MSCRLSACHKLTSCLVHLQSHLTVSQSSDVVLDEMSQYCSCVVLTVVLSMFWHPDCPRRPLSGRLFPETVVGLVVPRDSRQASPRRPLSGRLSPETVVRLVPGDPCQSGCPRRQSSGLSPETVVRLVPGDACQAGCPRRQSSSSGLSPETVVRLVPGTS